MKVGDYVRISNGQIAKITKIKEYKKWSNIIYTDIAIDMHEDRCCNENFIDEEDIIKSSPNIIDLIEVGDYVNGERVVDINQKYKYLELSDEEITTKSEDIKSIVTKEQFESMEYRFGE